MGNGESALAGPRVAERTVRILVVTNMYPPHHYGGYERSCQDVVERWRRRGHEVLVLTSDVRVPGVARHPAEDGDGVRRQLRMYWEDHHILNPPLVDRLRRERANQRALRLALADFRPEVVSAWAMGAMSLGLLTTVAAQGIPVVPVVCDEWPIYGPHVDAWLRPLVVRPRLGRLVGAVTGVPAELPPLDTAGPSCFISEFVRAACRARSPWRFPSSTVTYSGIDAPGFPFDDTRAVRAWGWRLLYFGRIDPRKGIDTAVRALAQCPPEATLTVDGRGDDRHKEELEALAAGLGVGDRLRFLVSPDRAALLGQMDVADAVVFPSRWEEPFGLVPVEAMARGVPVVATTVGGAAEFLVDGGNCLVFPADDPAALAAALGRLAGDASLRGRLVEGGRRTAEQLSVDQLAEVLEDWHVAAGAGAPLPADRPAVVLRRAGAS